MQNTKLRVFVVFAATSLSACAPNPLSSQDEAKAFFSETLPDATCNSRTQPGYQSVTCNFSETLSFGAQQSSEAEGGDTTGTALSMLVSHPNSADFMEVLSSVERSKIQEVFANVEGADDAIENCSVVGFSSVDSGSVRFTCTKLGDKTQFLVVSD